MIRTGTEKILTVEDPVEYELPGVPQVPVNEKVGVTFATALRALLRQDPDIIWWARSATRKPRRSPRRRRSRGTWCCPRCTPTTRRRRSRGCSTWTWRRTWWRARWTRCWRSGWCAASARTARQPAAPEKIAEQRLDLDALGLRHVWRGAGCDECRRTGYIGRIGIYELLVMDNELRVELQQRRGSEELRTMAITKGMRTLLDDGLRLVREGVTTLEEVLRVARG